MRRETGGSVVSLGSMASGSTGTGSTGSGGGAAATGSSGRRDVLSERLRAVAAANATAEREKIVNVEKVKTPSASPEREKEKVRSPPPAFASVTARKAFHRRSSSDIISARAPMWDIGGSDKDGDGELGRDLAAMLGGGIALVSRTGELSPPRVGSSDALSGLQEKEEGKDNKDSIAPIVIKQRSPPPAFSVTSRSAHQQARSVSAYGDLGPSVRQRSSTLVPVSAASSFGGSNRSGNSNSNSNSHTSTTNSSSNASSNANSNSGSSVSGTGNANLRARQRSSTMMPLGTTAPIPAPAASPSASPPSTSASQLSNPTRPFAAPRMVRNSPASSTGDSSSGPAPLTPRDGSDFGGSSVREEWSGGVSGLVPSGKRMPHQRRSVSFDFEEEVGGDGKGKAKAKAKPRETPVQEEERRRERRRSEARAAIELGNVINGRGPIADDDEDGDQDSDDDLPITQSRMNPMMGNVAGPMGMGMNIPMNNMGMQMGMNMPMGFGSPPGSMAPGWPGWQQQASPSMLSPAQFMVPPPADPNFFAAHQQAMMIAKQAYQMAVAQQAMAAAGDEWERGSNIGSTYGGGGGRASVYGGSTVGPSPPMGTPFGMMQSPGIGGWSPGGGMFPSAPRSMYGGGGARSEYGGGGGGGGWSSSRSVYGEAFGPSTERYSRSGSSGNLAAQAKTSSGYFPPVPAVPQGQSGRPGPGNPRQRTASQPASPSRTGAPRKPPSSWKAAP
ncbi:hypothetical protein C8R44DRAFT_757815 [Mycena epipterygia]|nr:hypothetical protein C8R44DRAFT_757815 [Mycena epipterygia]